MMLSVLAYLIIGAGLAIIFFGIYGMIILPDFLTRSHAATKCGITGTITVLFGYIVYAVELSFTLKMAVIIAFLFFTGPIAAHGLAFSYSRNKLFNDSEL